MTGGITIHVGFRTSICQLCRPPYETPEDEPEPNMHPGNNSSIDISRLHVFTRNIKGRQTRRARSINDHAWSLALG